MKTIATVFSGCGGVELGAIAAKPQLKSIWGVENNPKVVKVYQENIGDHIICQNAADVDISQLEPPDLLWASPPCQAFSSARTVETPHESRDTGLDIIRYIKALQPKMFVLENVPGFRKSLVFWEILKALGGYFVWFGILNAADFCVPQHRKRLICIASKELVRSWPRYAQVSWDSALRDEHLVEADFQPSIKRWLPESLPEKALIDTQYSKREKGRERKITIREAGRPSITICKSHGKRNIRVWQDEKAYRLLPSGFAALQSFPDSYIMPKSKQLAIGVIGDAVPPLMAQLIFEAVL
jgi:DNA (cytosine-5)-methyltransferase 1